MTAKKIIIFALIVLIIIALFYLAWNFNKVEFGGEGKIIRGNEAEILKKVNKRMLEKSESASFQAVKAISSADHVWGGDDAPIQLIVYSDFACPFSARFYEVIKRIKDEFGDKVAVAIRHFPLSLHAMAMSASLAAECAGEQGKFWEMYNKLFADNQDNNLSISRFKKNAADLGLNQARFDQCLETEKYRNKIQKEITEGKSFGVTGTPGSFVNGEPVAGAVPFANFTDSQNRQREGMKSIIERHLRERENPVE